MALEGLDHRVGVLRTREQEDRRALLGHLGAPLVDESVVEMGLLPGVAGAAHGGAPDEPDGESGRTEEHARYGTGQGALGRALADYDVRLVIQIEVAAGERAADHDPVV